MTDRTIRVLTAAAVLTVALIAAVVSFVHIEHLAVIHGQTRLAAFLLPLSIDGTVLAASLVMLQAARAAIRTPWLARVMLGLAVTATLAANVAYGWPAGPWWSLLSGWPALAFIGCAEMALGMVRRSVRKATAPASARTTRKASAVASGKASSKATRKARARASSGGTDAATRSAVEAARQGQPVPSARALARDFHIGRDKATQVRASVLTEANGHGGQPGHLTST